MLLNGIWQEITDAVVNNLILENRYQLILDGLRTTLIITVFAAVAAISLLYLRKRRNTGYTYSENIGSDAVIKVSQLK